MFIMLLLPVKQTLEQADISNPKTYMLVRLFPFFDKQFYR